MFCNPTYPHPTSCLKILKKMLNNVIFLSVPGPPKVSSHNERRVRDVAWLDRPGTLGRRGLPRVRRGPGSRGGRDPSRPGAALQQTQSGQTARLQIGRGCPGTPPRPFAPSSSPSPPSCTSWPPRGPGNSSVGRGTSQSSTGPRDGGQTQGVLRIAKEIPGKSIMLYFMTRNINVVSFQVL